MLLKVLHPDGHQNLIKCSLGNAQALQKNLSKSFNFFINLVTRQTDRQTTIQS